MAVVLILRKSVYRHARNYKQTVIPFEAGSAVLIDGANTRKSRQNGSGQAEQAEQTERENAWSDPRLESFRKERLITMKQTLGQYEAALRHLVDCSDSCKAVPECFHTKIDSLATETSAKWSAKNENPHPEQIVIFNSNFILPVKPTYAEKLRNTVQLFYPSWESSAVRISRNSGQWLNTQPFGQEWLIS
ncbi:hypothetical protein T265_08106 [Opisthorchis viverrini]|uniref:Uncharacterized protein n=1 Tax=Opisthorchis viverrini TaxID=6198 RepID=A0A074ZAQ5_OPIVI|nr:hypothetical protein T265_08106 [Opisthorchis viverrini]KER24168.1 hypothetical protein T265_08106 [Opisthorchis viverrini]